MWIELLLAFVGAVPLTSWLTSLLMRRKYNVEISKIKADVRSDELDNVSKGVDIIMQQIVAPLEKQIKTLNNNVSKLEKAIKKISACPYSAQCPVSDELYLSEKGSHAPAK